MNLALETDRLILRPFEQADRNAMFVMDSNPKVHRFLGNEPLTAIEQVDSYIKAIQQQYEDNGIGRFVVQLKETQEVIGWAGLKFITEPENNHVNYYDIGYRLAEAYWGKGYATEAAIAWRNYAFNVMKVPAIFAVAHQENTGSNAVLRKIGMINTQEFMHQDVPCFWYELKNPLSI
jgi:ribosomal-protein-alanine N-acetyltransferase